MDQIIIITAKYRLYVIALIGAIYWLTFSSSKKRKLAVIGGISAIISFVLIKIAGLFYYDPRPFVVHHTQPLLKHAADNGFPSDHTVVATLAALTVFQVSRKVGVSMFVLAVTLGLSRVAAQVHSPIDIAGGIAIGAISVALAIPIAKRFDGHNELVLAQKPSRPSI
jgi:undecaprenyl-diphosphatase